MSHRVNPSWPNIIGARHIHARLVGVATRHRVPTGGPVKVVGASLAISSEEIELADLDTVSSLSGCVLDHSHEVQSGHRCVSTARDQRNKERRRAGTRQDIRWEEDRSIDVFDGATCSSVNTEVVSSGESNIKGDLKNFADFRSDCKRLWGTQIWEGDSSIEAGVRSCVKTRIGEAHLRSGEEKIRKIQIWEGVEGREWLTV
jgi:hypothetical protein